MHLPRIIFWSLPLLLIASCISGFCLNVLCFENSWLDYSDCHFSVWKVTNFHPHSSPMQAIVYILSKVRANLFFWKSQGNCNLDSDLRATEVNIQALENEEIGSSFNLSNLDNLHSLYNKHKTSLRLNSKRWEF